MKNKLDRSVFRKMLVYSLIPVIVMFFVVIVVQTYQSSRLKEKTIAKYADTFKSNLIQIETSIDQIVDSVELLSANDNISEIMTLPQGDYRESVSKNYAIQDTLQRCKNIYNCISNIAIVNKNSGIVIDSNSRMSFDDYYTMRRKYENYDKDFWKNFKIQNSGYDILSPVSVVQSEKKEDVFPMIIGSMRDVKTGNFIVIDLKCDMILNMLENGSLGNKNMFFVIDERNDKAISFDKSVSNEILENPSIKRNIIDKQSFEYSLDKEKYLIISHKDNISFMNQFRYVVMVPQREILAEYDAGIHTIYWLMAVFILVVTFLCYYFSRKLYSPVAAMTDELRSHRIYGGDIKNEFEFISQSLNKMMDDNSTLKDVIRKKFSMLNEQALLKALNSTVYMDSHEIDHLLSENGFLFDKDFFVAAYIKIKFTDEFYDLFNQDQYMQISDGLYSVFNMQFNNKNKSILIARGNEEYIVLFNIREDGFDDVVKMLNDAAKVFGTDKSLMRVLVGIGNTYKGYSGMRTSYTEAIRAQSVLGSMSDKSILVYHKTDDSVIGYKYSIEQENILLNYILKGDTKNAMAVITKVAEENYDYVGNKGIKKVYNQILQTVLRAIVVKNVDIRKELGESYISPTSSYDELNDEDFIDYVNELTKIVAYHTDVKNTQKDIGGLIEYIDEHYAEDIYLENMAEMFNTSPKYLSRLIKNQLGVNFSQYVAKIRIEKAKGLLATTNKNVNDIMLLTGFNMRNTFIRTFRKFEGVTPSEYRKIAGKDDTVKEMNDKGLN